MPKDFSVEKLPGAWHMRFVDAVAWAQRHPNQEARLVKLFELFAPGICFTPVSGFLFHMQNDLDMILHVTSVTF